MALHTVRIAHGPVRGTTLVEVLITMAVFSLLMVAMFTITRMGTNGWHSVNARTDVNTTIHRLELDMTQSLEQAFLATVTHYTPSNDFHWAMWFQSPMNDPGRFDPSTGLPVAPLGDPSQLVTFGGIPMPQRWVLYYVTRPSAAEHQALYGYLCNSYGSSNGPDQSCPHKWIVRKDIYLKDSGGNPVTLTGANISTYTTDLVDTSAGNTQSEEGLVEEEENASYANGTVHRTKVLASNVLSFEIARLALGTPPSAPPVASPTGPIILFDIKLFKTEEAQKIMTLGQTAMVNVSTAAGQVQVQTVTDNQGTKTTVPQATVAPAFASFTVQVDNRVIPRN